MVVVEVLPQGLPFPAIIVVIDPGLYLSDHYSPRGNQLEFFFLIVRELLRDKCSSKGYKHANKK
jgi:hypothetical protein